MAYTLGKNSLLYRGTAGTKASTLVNTVISVKENDSMEEGDTTARNSGDNETSLSCLRSYSLDIEMLEDDTDAHYGAFRAAYLANTPIALLCIKQEDGTGVDGDFVILNFKRAYGTKDVAKVSFSAKLTLSSRLPVSVAG